MADLHARALQQGYAGIFSWAYTCTNLDAGCRPRALAEASARRRSGRGEAAAAEAEGVRVRVLRSGASYGGLSCREQAERASASG